MSLGAPTITVVMANYNGASHIEAAIQSVLTQTFDDLELIVVDDASTDGSIAIVGRLALADSRVRLLCQPRNLGPAAARNRGIEAGAGRWFAIVDSDDTLEPARFARLLSRAMEDAAELIADNQLVFSDTDAFPPHLLLAGPEFEGPQWITPTDFVTGGVMYGRGPDFGFLKPMISARALDGVRYDETLRIGEDYDILLRLMLKTGRMRIEPTALYRYRKHQNSISHRLKPDDLVRMLAAQDRLSLEVSEFQPAFRKALDARRRSLDKALVYERVVENAKAGAFLPSAGAVLRHPSVWSLVAQLATTRLKRQLGAARQSPASPVSP